MGHYEIIYIHLAVQCNPPGSMSAFLRDFKKFTSKKFIETMANIHESRSEWLLDKFAFEANKKRAENHKTWKDDNHAIDLNDIDIMGKKVNYIHDNPVRAGLVEFPENYIYSSAKVLCRVEKGLVEVTVVLNIICDKLLLPVFFVRNEDD